MQAPFDTILEHWLAAEKAGRDGEAERALERAFSALPAITPAAGFADRVLAATMPARLPAGALVGSVRRTANLARWGRAAVAACLLLAGLAAAYLLPLMLSLSQVIAPAEAIGGLVRGFVSVLGRIDELLSLWRVWAWMLDTALLVATAPPVVLALLTLTVLSALTFRGLQRALVPNRSLDHAAV